MKKILSALLMTAVFAVPAYADMHGKEMKEHKKCECQEQMGKCQMHRRGDMLGMLIKHADKVGLTADQVVKLKDIQRGKERKEIRSEADLKLARLDLKELMEVKNFDLEKANTQVQKISDIKKAQHLEMLKSVKEARGILTDAQFKKISEMKHQMWGMEKPEGKKREMKKHKEQRQE